MVKNSEAFRENAENCLFLAENAANEPTSARYKRMADAWTALATEQDWLDGEPAHTQTGRASDLAERAIDRLSEEGASSADVNDRKTRLIDGPAEFRDTRVDND
jgi:hypothetical protein